GKLWRIGVLLTRVCTHKDGDEAGPQSRTCRTTVRLADMPSFRGGWLADLWLFVTPTKAVRRSCPISLTRNDGSSYSEEPGMEVLQHGEARLRIEPITGRLRRPPGICAWSRALSSLHRASARLDRQCVRSPHVRGHALLGRRPS